MLAAIGDAHPTVASFAVSRLNESLGSAAADQRARARTDAIRLTVADVDTALADAQSAVDVSGLDSAITSGVCSPADFLNASELDPAEFYLGVDGHPGHIAAGLDVVRTRELTECAEGAAFERYVLLLGPSGAGKSVLLWRAARDAVPGARVIRVRRVDNSEDMDLLVRHVRLLRPSSVSPVVVAADNLGRPGMSAWPHAATTLREQPSVVLFGACRAEDFHPSLASGAVRIVEPRVDDSTAQAIAGQVLAAGIATRMDAIEAHHNAQGLLMEFLALLTTGRRLRQVLAEQAQRLREPGRELQRDAARLLTAAHSAGLSIDADRLGHALVSTHSDTRRLEDVGDALSLLKDEHIVINDGHAWHGLHELRSTALTELLHESPPPTLAMTWSRTAALLTPAQAGWLLRRVAEKTPAEVLAVAEATAALVSDPATTALQAAELLEGAERADNALYARACKPILEAGLPSSMSLHALALLVYYARNQEQSGGHSGGSEWDRRLDRVKAIAVRMPERTAASSVATATRVAAGVTDEVLRRLLATASSADAARLLEAAAGLISISADLIRQVLAQLPAPNDVVSAGLWGRIIKVCADHLKQEDWSAVLGTAERRAATVTGADPNALSCVVDQVSHSATMTRLLPLDAPEQAVQAWDTPPRSHSSDIANHEAVAAAQRLADACPELTTFEIITVTASGKRYKIADLEPGAKCMSRDAFKDRVSVRRSVGFQAALRRAAAATSWTEIVREQITISGRLTTLAEQAVARLSAHDNQPRRRHWSENLAQVQAQATALATRPAITGVDPAISHAGADDADRAEDAVSKALSAVAGALSRVIEGGKPLGVAISIRDAVAGLVSASAQSNPTLAHLGSPIPNELVLALTRLANTLAALDRDPTVARHIRARDIQGSADGLIATAVEALHSRQHEILSTALTSVPDVQLIRFQDPTPTTLTLDDTAWLVAVPVEYWQETITALRTIDDGERQELGCRVVAVAVDTLDQEREQSSSTRSPQEQTTLLPVAVQLGSTTARPEYPLPVDALQPVAQAVGFTVRTGGQQAATIADIVSDLVKISWNQARRLMRSGLRPDDASSTEAAQPNETIRQLDDLRGRGVEAVSQLSSEASIIASQALDVLINQVTEECAGNSDIRLAGELFDQHEHFTMFASQSPRLWEAITQLSLSGLYENEL